MGIWSAVHPAASADSVLTVQQEGDFRVISALEVQRNHRSALFHVAGSDQTDAILMQVIDFFNKCLCRDPGASTINYMNFVDFVI